MQFMNLILNMCIVQRVITPKIIIRLKRLRSVYLLSCTIIIDNVNMQSVNSWLLITTKHMALNYKRDYARETLIDELLYDNEVGDSLETCYITEFDRTKRKELADEIYLRLFEENKRWYDAIMAVYLLEKPQKEVAREMGISLEVLHSMLYRAKKWIRKNYEKRYRYLDEA